MRENCLSILYYHRTADAGAAASHIRQLVDALRKLGHEADLSSPPGVDILKGDSGSLVGGRLRNLPQWAREIFEFCYNFVGFFRLGAALSSKKTYHMIYERYAIFGCVGAIWSRIKKIPLILEVNFTSSTSSDIYPVRTRILHFLENCIDRWVFNVADGITVVSQALKRHLVEDYGLDPEKILVMPNAIDPSIFHPDISGEQSRARWGIKGKKVVGFVGGFYPWHGVHLLVEAAQEVLREVPETFFLLIGEGHEKRHLEKRVEELGLDSAFRFLGFIAHHRLPQCISAFDVGVVPDTGRFSCPMKILEYMGMGKPVIAPRVGNIEELMEDGKEGLLFKSQNQEALAHCIIKLLKNSTIRNRMGTLGNARVLSSHTWEANARTLCAYTEQLREKHRDIKR